MTKTLLATDGVSVHYAVGGDSSGPTIILIHGAGSNHTTWLNATEHFKGIKWIAIDCRGHGNTNGVPDIKKTASDVLAIADREGVNEFAIAGICMGGTIAHEVAKHASTRVTGIVIVSPFDRHLVRFSSFLRAFCSTVRSMVRLFPMRKNLSYVNYRTPSNAPFMLTPYRDCKGVHMRHYGTAALNCIDMPTPLQTAMPLLVITGNNDTFLKRNVLKKRLAKNRLAHWVEIDTNHHALRAARQTGTLITRFVHDTTRMQIRIPTRR